MQLAFVGNENMIAVYSKILQGALQKRPESTLKICGVMSVSPTATTNLAVELNTRAFLNLEDLVREADVIFICRQDSQLASFSDTLKQRRVRGKIICHASSRYDSSIIYCGSTNTYFSVGFPYMPVLHQDISKTPISFEGAGKRYDEFAKCISQVFPKAVFCSKNEKRLGALASRVVSDYLRFIVGVSVSFFKFAGFYDKDCFRDFVMHNIKDITEGNEWKKLHKKTEGEMRKDIRLLSAVNYNHTGELYRSMESQIADTGIYSPDEKETIARILKKKF